MSKKLLLLIPAFNEENFIASAINDIPKKISGIGAIEIAVIDDGSADNTVKTAIDAGADKIIDLGGHLGLGAALQTGLKYGINTGADIIVIFDADSQYYGKDIEKIIAPILTENKPAVIGRRNFRKTKGYPLYMKISQKTGSLIAGLLFSSVIKDITSGFRAYTRETAEALAEGFRDPYEEAIESICFMARKKIPITWILIDIRYPTRPSRLIANKLYFAKYFFSTLGKYFFLRLKSSRYLPEKTGRQEY
jgi:glycosyltransferase involved in cell wall biosynthesis